MSSFREAVAPSSPEAASAAIKTARSQIAELLSYEPALRSAFLRLAFYDAILHDPARPKGSIRSTYALVELPDNVKTAISRLEKLRANDVNVSLYVPYADLYQLAGVEAIKSLSGIDIQFRPGRLDYYDPVPLDKLQKFALAQEGDDAVLVRSIFYPLGFTDKEIVALFSAIIYAMYPSLFNIGATSGSIDLCSIYVELINKLKEKVTSKVNEALNIDPNKQTSTKGTGPSEVPISQQQPSTKGTGPNDNSKTQSLSPSDNLKTQSLSTIASDAARSFTHWKCLVSDPSFRKHVDTFAKDKEQFKVEYKSAHEKLLELGLQHSPKVEYHEAKHSLAFAVAMAILVGVVGFFYETMRI